MSASAQQPADWQCASCPDPAGWELDLQLAPAYVADDAYRFGDHTGLDEKGGYLFGQLFARYRDRDANYFQVDGFTLSPDFSAIFLEGGKQGVYELSGSYRSIPRRFYDATVTPFLGSGTDTLALPDGFVRGSTTAAMTDLTDALEPVTVRRDWDVLKLGADIRSDSRWSFAAEYGHTERSGRNLDAASFLFDAMELVSPVDYTTDDLELAVAYQGNAWQARLSYLGSYFDNGDESLSWDNAYTTLPGVDAGALALAPDNESHQVALAASVRLPKRTILSGQLALGHLTQDEELLPYTITPGIPGSPLPLNSAEAEAETLNLNFRVVSSPWRKTTLEAEFRLHDFNNDTATNLYDYVVTDSLPQEFPVPNLTYDYERTELKLRGEYRATRQTRLHFGFDTRIFRRSFQDRSKTRTNKVWFTLKQRLGRGADVETDLFVEDRAGSSYETLTRPDSQQNPLLHKYNLSDRERYGIRLRGSLYPMERWDLGFEFEYGQDDYEKTLIGLTETSYARAGLDASWLLSDRGSLFASVFTERVEVEQAGSQNFSSPDWTATTQDDFDTLTLGFDYPELLGPVGLRIDYSWSRGRGKSANNTSGLVSGFPDLNSTRRTFGLGLDYPVRDRWQIAFDYYREELDSDDWGLDGLEPTTIPNLLALGADPFNHDVNVFYFTVRYVR